MASKILVIEDDSDYQATLKEILTSEGYEVALAPSGIEGLKRVKEVNPDLIILDVMMESTISGFEVAYRLKSRDPKSEYAASVNIPILILTAIHKSTSFRFRPDEEYIPIEAFLEKPPSPDELLKRIKTLLEMRP